MHAVSRHGTLRAACQSLIDTPAHFFVPEAKVKHSGVGCRVRLPVDRPIQGGRARRGGAGRWHVLTLTYPGAILAGH